MVVILWVITAVRAARSVRRLSTAVTVTVWGWFHVDGVKVSAAGCTVAAPASLLATAITTSTVGLAPSLTV